MGRWLGLGLLPWACSAGAALAKPGAADLMPLRAGEFRLDPQASPEAVAETINTDLAAAQAPDDAGLDFSQIPILSEFVDEEGNIGLPVDLPFSVTVIDSFGDYAVGINHSF